MKSLILGTFKFMFSYKKTIVLFGRDVGTHKSQEREPPAKPQLFVREERGVGKTRHGV